MHIIVQAPTNGESISVVLRVQTVSSMSSGRRQGIRKTLCMGHCVKQLERCMCNARPEYQTPPSIGVDSANMLSKLCPWQGSLPLPTISYTTHTPSAFYFTYRPPITFAKRTDSQRKSLHRKHHFTQRRLIPQLPSNSRCARLRIWYEEASTRRKQCSVTIAGVGLQRSTYILKTQDHRF